MDEIIAGFNLVLLGKTGAGKSAAGNTILGREAFESKKCAKSLTNVVSKESTTVCGYSVTVYDTPGFFDTEVKEQEIQLNYQKLIQKCESGRCVFLLVIKADRFTEEERKTVEKIEKLLGEKRLEKTWILFTRGDELEEENMTIQEFINGTEALKKLVQKYEQRYHVFNNKKRGHTGQVKTLFIKFLASFKTMGARLNPLKRKSPKKVKQATPADSLSSRRIVLLGKTGVGKSASGNTILGQKEFRSVRSTSSVTRECLEAHATVSGRSVSVVDTPGFFDTRMNLEELMIEIARSVYISSPGPHAFIIVLRADDRFTEQELQIIQMIKMMFGQEVLKYSIILFTRGDQLKGKSVEELIKENSALRDLVQQCGGRYHVFNNKNKKNIEQVNDLLQKIDTIEQNGGGYYSNQMLEDAERFRREEEEQRQKEEEERQKEEEERQREEEERKLREKQQRQREEEERKQLEEKQRQEEIERVRKETEERIRAEYETKQKPELEKHEALIQGETNETKEEQQRQDEIDSDKTTSAQCDAQLKVEQKMLETSSGFRNFFSKYQKYFYAAAIVFGFVIGAATVGGAVVTGAVVAGAVICSAVIGGAAAGAVVGGVGGAVAGGFFCGVAKKHFTADTTDS